MIGGHRLISAINFRKFIGPHLFESYDAYCIQEILHLSGEISTHLGNQSHLLLRTNDSEGDKHVVGQFWYLWF